MISKNREDWLPARDLTSRLGAVRLRTVHRHREIAGVPDVGKGGHANRRPSPWLPQAAYRFCERIAVEEEPDGGVVAYHRGRLVGFCRYNYHPYWTKQAASLVFLGTWVDARFRKRGVGTGMWALVLGQLAPGTGIQTVTISPQGEKMVAGLRRGYPLLSWSER